MKYNPYSVSKISTYLQCPNKFKLKYIDKIKVPFETNKALIKGKIIHEILENNFNYDVSFKPSEVYTKEDHQKTLKLVKEFEESDLGKMTKNLQKVGIPEEDFAFTLDKELVGFWDKNAFLRGSADLYLTKENLGVIIDYKSGKDKSNDESFGINQAKMYAIYMFLKYSEIDIVKASFFFIEHGTRKTIEFYRDNLERYIQDFKDLVRIAEKDSEYIKRTSPLCDYCEFFHHKHCDGKDEPFHISTGGLPF